MQPVILNPFKFTDCELFLWFHHRIVRTVLNGGHFKFKAQLSYTVIVHNRKQIQAYRVTDSLQELAQIPFTVSLNLLAISNNYDYMRTRPYFDFLDKYSKRNFHRELMANQFTYS